MKRLLSTLSNRQAFKQIQPDRKVLEFLDKVGLGRPIEKGTRRAVALKRHEYGLSRHVGTKTPSSFPLAAAEEPPHPFNRGPRSVTRILQIDSFEELPDYGSVPEVAVLGRSNVGKSTLLNALLGFSSHIQKASVSSKPGETKKLQFFCIGSYNNKKSAPKLAVVDMPGYGFSYMPEGVATDVSTLTTNYICDRGPVLKRVLLILDARHGFKKTDTEYFNELVAQVKLRGGRRPQWKLQVVLTKCDLVSRHDVARRVVKVRQQMDEQLPGIALSNLPIVMVSGHEKRGIVQLQRELASLVPPPIVPRSPEPAAATEAGGASEKESIETKNSTMKDKLKIDKKTAIMAPVKKTAPRTAGVGDKAKSVGKPPADVVARAPSEDSNGGIQAVSKGLKVDKNIREIENVKIAPGLRRKTVITKPAMHEYEAAMAPPAPGATTLTMSDRLDVILDHYLSQAKPARQNSEDNSVKNEKQQSPIFQVKPEGTNSRTTEMNTGDVAGDRVGYYERIKALIRDKRSGVTEAVPGADSGQKGRGRKARSEEELRQIEERKNSYRSRYGKKAPES